MLNQENMPGAGSVADTIEFMKQMWSGVGTPSMAMPSLSVEDINKKIGDLKTVASWLELNLNMLKATIQTLEVQSATLSTLQAMSAILASRGPEEQPTADAAQPAAGFPFGFPMWPGAMPQADADEQPADAAQASEPEPEPQPEVEPAADGEAVPPADFQSAIANPNAWWNLLQEQFTQAVGNALASNPATVEPVMPPGKPGSGGTGAKRSEKKTVAPKAKPGRSAAVKPGANGANKAVSKASAGAKPVKKAVNGRATASKAAKSGANTSAPARAGVVQSRQTKKPAPRKPTSP